jgi:hypothetical protein
MKKHLFITLAALGCSLALYSTASAQTALFIYDDGNGVPNAGTYQPGSSFTFSINLAFTPGGSVANLEGLSYWMQQRTPAGSPFNFSITLRDVTGSGFTDLQTPGLTYPQTLNPSNANDLGAALPVGQPADGAGTYLVANITVFINDTAPISGTYVLSNTLSGGKTSVISDNAGHTFAIPEADYTVTLVPEPATWLAAAMVFAALAFGQRRRVLTFARR